MPAPVPYKGFDGTIHIDLFFEIFERYCLSAYKETPEAWLQILPNYLEGDAKAVTLAYGLTTPYTTVKEKLQEKFRSRSRLDEDDIHEIFLVS